MDERLHGIAVERKRGITELARRLMNAARRVTASESDAEELVRDGFSRCVVPEEVSTTYSREFEEILARCARSPKDRTKVDEHEINSFVYRLTLTTRRDFQRKQMQTAKFTSKLAEYESAILDSIEEELCKWSDNEEMVTRVLDELLTEIAKKNDKPIGKALGDRLRSEFVPVNSRAMSQEIAAKHGISASTLRSSWRRLLITVAKRNTRC